MQPHQTLPLPFTTHTTAAVLIYIKMACDTLVAMQQFPYLSQISGSPVPDNLTEVLLIIILLV